MQQGTCCQCGLTASIRSFYSLNGRIYCEPCVWKAAREAREAGEPAEYSSLTDNTVCSRCQADSGGADFPLVGKYPFCPNCAQLVSNWPYPQWMKIALVLLSALLAISLVHGRKYFQAGRTMYLGERLVEDHRYAEALPYLQQTLRVAPGSDKAVLLTAKAALLTGEFEVAQKALQGHNGGRFEDGNSSEFREVDAIWKRAVDALEKADQAYKLVEQENTGVEAARLMHEAASLYPEATGLAITAEYFDEGAAFDRRDYDTFVSIAQKQWKQYPLSATAAALASALACKYAVTRDPLYRQQSEEMLAKAQQLAGGSDAQKSFEEYSERIRYRLSSCEIISKQEYDRRFRANKKDPR